MQTFLMKIVVLCCVVLAGAVQCADVTHAPAPVPQTPDAASLALLRAKWTRFLLGRAAVTPRHKFNLATPQAFAVPQYFVPASPPPLPSLETLTSAGGKLNTTLVVDFAENLIARPDRQTPDQVYLRSYSTAVGQNGKLIGPVWRVKRNDVISVNLINNLPPNPPPPNPPPPPLPQPLHDLNTTNLHTHGLFLSPSGNHDNVLASYLPQTQTPLEFTIDPTQSCGMYWFHPHHHGSTAVQVSSGMAGVLIVEGADVDLVPEIQQAAEKILLLQQITYGDNGEITPDNLGDLFGPGDWDLSGHFTTVNGIVQPLLQMQPEEVQRWRILDAAFRENIALKLRKIDGDGPDTIAFNEYAKDGLPTGAIAPVSQLALAPGYRSEALVQAPNMTAGTYILHDERQAIPDEMHRTLAVLKIGGAHKPMNLPVAAQLAGFRLKELKDLPVDHPRSMVYKVVVPPPLLRFTINNTSFDVNNPLVLKLGDLEEWTLQGFNDGHPFHIHVNPFEVLADNFNGVNLVTAPYFKDTLFMESGHTYTIRQKYEKYPGDFVQHCHILDHEDQGMMMLVSVRTDPGIPNNLPTGNELVDAAGQTQHLESFSAARQTTLLLNKSVTCPHCLAQLNAFAALHRAGRLNIVAVFPEKPNAEFGHAFPFPVLFDPSLSLYKKFNCLAENQPLHGAFLLNANGTAARRWIGDEPLMDPSVLLDKAGEVRMASLTVAAAPRERKNIDEMSAQELKNYIHAVDMLKKSTDPNNNYMFFANLHNLFNDDPPSGCWHGNDYFLPWHRWLLYAFEQALQNSDPNNPDTPTRDVTVPYWDWTTPAKGGGRFPDAFLDPVLANNRPGTLPMFSKKEVDDMVCSIDDWNRFGGLINAEGGGFGALEQPYHNSMHSRYLAGNMANPATAAIDPIFWSFHCYIDLLWDRWQKIHKKPPTSLGERLMEFNGPGHPPTIADTVSVEALGYMFTHKPADLQPCPQVPGTPEIRSFASTMVAARNAVAVWGGSGPFRFSIDAPNRAFNHAEIWLSNIRVPGNLSYTANVYVHVDGLAPAQAEVPANLAGTIDVLADHRARTVSGAFVRATAKIQEVLKAAPGKPFVVTVSIEPHLLEGVPAPNLLEEIRFDGVKLLLDHPSLRALQTKVIKHER